MKDVTVGIVCVDGGIGGKISWEVPSELKQVMEMADPRLQLELQEAFEPALRMFLFSLAGITSSDGMLAQAGLVSLMRKMEEFSREQIDLLRAAREKFMN